MPLSDHDLQGLSTPSQLFTIRVWVEATPHENRKVRVQVKHVLSGATHTFREWSQVIAFIEDRLQGREESPSLPFT